MPSTIDPNTPPSKPPIRVTPKTRGNAGKQKNVFIDNQGFPDQSNEFDSLLHNVDGGTILRKCKHPDPSLDSINPRFHAVYDEKLDSKQLRKNINLSHLDASLQSKIYGLIKKYWSVFSAKGQFVPVKDYSCIINTGKAKPIAVKKIHYGPCEIPIMEKCIAALEKLGHIRQIHDGKWLFKALLAPKPHQEGVTNTCDFVWRFCVNYIPLNQVTCIIPYQIPRCNSAIFLAFGTASWFWMWDAPQGYHQIRVAKESQEKLAFARPNATKWTYNVMPFGPVNGPSTFIFFIHNMDGTWKDVARSLGLVINEDMNTTIIVDNIVSWARQADQALAYMECQLRVCQSQNLSLSLAKSHIFPKQFEFIGVNVSSDGNRPAMSKHALLHHWPAPELVCDVAKFVGFSQFYLPFIPQFEQRISALRNIMKNEYMEFVNPYWMREAKAEFMDIRSAILADPCLKRYNHRLLLVLRTNFSKDGFGYVALQPGNNAESWLAMKRCMGGKKFEFMDKSSKGILHPVAFSCRCT
jgi:hypothetical protein